MSRIKSILAIGTALLSTPAASEDIHLAAQKGDTEAIQALLEGGTPTDQLSTRDTSVPGWTALAVAAQWGRLDAAKLLLDAGADPNFCNIDAKDTPLTLATKTGKIEMMALLMDRGANPDQRCTPAGLALQWARQFRRADAETLLIERGATTSFTRPSVKHLLADADIERGAKLTKTCHFCHGQDTESPSLEGATLPRLWNVVGREKGSQPGYRYSQAMIEAGGTWTYDDLNSFLADPFGYMPGTNMGLASLELTDDQRADIIA